MADSNPLLVTNAKAEALMAVLSRLIANIAVLLPHSRSGNEKVGYR